jgi:hypothetical protein
MLVCPGMQSRSQSHNGSESEESLGFVRCLWRMFADAVVNSQVLWMRRLRVLRRLLVKYRAAGKIDKHLYHELYHLSKGNTFKHKRALVEHVRWPMTS